MNEDPLEITPLAVSYDYLVYKIKDHILTLAESTYLSVKKKHELVDDYLTKQLDLHTEIESIDALIKECTSLQQDMQKLQQLRMFIDDFKVRMDAVEKGYKEVMNERG